jgi:hypothetical protein
MGDLGAIPGMISVERWMEVQDSEKTGLNELEDIPERGRDSLGTQLPKEHS